MTTSTDKPPDAQRPTPPRRWYRPYRPTIVLVGLVFALLFLANVPAHDDWYSEPRLKHGWPLTYMWRWYGAWDDSRVLNPYADEYDPWRHFLSLSKTYWSLAADVHELHIVALLVDLLACGVILVAVFLVWQWRCRRRRLLQFSIGEIFLLMFICALLARETYHHRRIVAAIEVLRTHGDLVDVDWESRLWPDWVPRLHIFPSSNDASTLDDKEASTFGDDRASTIRGEEETTPSFPWAEPRQIEIYTPYEESQIQPEKWQRHVKTIVDRYGRRCELNLTDRQYHREGKPVKTFVDLSSLTGLEAIGRLRVDRADKELLQRLDLFPLLRELVVWNSTDAYESYVDDSFLSGVSQLSRLEYLELSASEGFVSDKGLEHLVGLKNLQMLELPPSPLVTDAGLAHLGSMTSLRHLILPGANITNDGLAQLAGLDKLDSLWLPGTHIGDDALRHIAKLRQLQQLDLAGADIYGPGLAHLAPLSKLTELSLSGTHVTDAHLGHLNKLTSLTSLDLDFTPVRDLQTLNLSGLPQLEYLGLRQSGMPMKKIKAIRRKYPMLKSFAFMSTGIPRSKTPSADFELRLDAIRRGETTSLHLHAQFTDDDIAELAKLSTLNSLHLSNATDTALQGLTSLVNVEEIYLGGAHISDEGIAHVTRFVKLRDLDLGSTCVTGSGLSRLKVLKNLEILCLDGTVIGDDDLRHLVSMTQLVELDLSSTRVTAGGLAKLPLLKSLEALDLSWWQFDEHSADVLAKLPSLKELRIVDMTPLFEPTAEQLRRALPGVEVRQRDW